MDFIPCELPPRLLVFFSLLHPICQQNLLSLSLEYIQNPATFHVYHLHPLDHPKGPCPHSPFFVPEGSKPEGSSEAQIRSQVSPPLYKQSQSHHGGQNFSAISLFLIFLPSYAALCLLKSSGTGFFVFPQSFLTHNRLRFFVWTVLSA